MGMSGALVALLAAASLAWACVPAGNLTVAPKSGPAGSSATASLSGFPPGEPIEIRWNALDGKVLGNGTAPTVPFAVPADAAPGTYIVVAMTTDEHGDHSAARATFTISGAAAPPPSTPPASNPILTPVGPMVPESGTTESGGKRITGTSRSETLTGTRFADVIICGAGNDRVRGGGGNDVIKCGSGRDNVDGGAGNDKIFGGAGNDKIFGGAGNDKLLGGPGKDRLLGGAGNDTLRGEAGKDRLFGNLGRDLLFRGGSDFVSGGPGKNRIVR